MSSVATPPNQAPTQYQRAIQIEWIVPANAPADPRKAARMAFDDMLEQMLCGYMPCVDLTYELPDGATGDVPPSQLIDLAKGS